MRPSEEQPATILLSDAPVLQSRVFSQNSLELHAGRDRSAETTV